jgi:hypothetical protein
MGVRGRDNVRAGFSWDVIVGRLAEVYARVRRPHRNSDRLTL